MNLLRVKYREQEWIYSGLNAGNKDWFTPGLTVGARMNFLLNVQCCEQGWVYSGLNALLKDEFTLGWMLGARMNLLWVEFNLVWIGKGAEQCGFYLF